MLNQARMYEPHYLLPPPRDMHYPKGRSPSVKEYSLLKLDSKNKKAARPQNCERIFFAPQTSHPEGMRI